MHFVSLRHLQTNAQQSSTQHDLFCRGDTTLRAGRCLSAHTVGPNESWLRFWPAHLICWQGQPQLTPQGCCWQGLRCWPSCKTLDHCFQCLGSQHQRPLKGLGTGRVVERTVGSDIWCEHLRPRGGAVSQQMPSALHCQRAKTPSAPLCGGLRPTHQPTRQSSASVYHLYTRTGFPSGAGRLWSWGHCLPSLAPGRRVDWATLAPCPGLPPPWSSPGEHMCSTCRVLAGARDRAMRACAGGAHRPVLSGGPAWPLLSETTHNSLLPEALLPFPHPL